MTVRCLKESCRGKSDAEVMVIELGATSTT